MGGQINFILGG